MSQLIKIITYPDRTEREYCDGHDHITKVDDKETGRDPCCCAFEYKTSTVQVPGVGPCQFSND